MKPFDPNAETRKTRRNLPHWEQDGCLYFVTFRLADSLAREQLDAWVEERKIWFAHHPQPWDNDTWKEYDRRFAKVIDGWLDAGAGACLLGRPSLRRIVSDALGYFDGERYDLDAYVVMPNHVHALVAPREGWDIGKIRHAWKSFTAKKIHKACGTSGEFWRDEGFDHIVRSKSHLEHYRRYIQENPVKARLAGDMFTHWQKPVECTTGLECTTGILPVAQSDRPATPQDHPEDPHMECTTGVPPVAFPEHRQDAGGTLQKTLPILPPHVFPACLSAISP